MSGNRLKVAVVGSVECGVLYACAEVGGDGEIFGKDSEGGISERNKILASCVGKKCPKLRIVEIESVEIVEAVAAAK